MPIKPNIIFIISTGHSGSTLVDLLLGTLPGVFSTGELVWLPWQTYRDGKMCTASPKQDICTCLNTFRACQVWGSVLHDINNQSSIDILKDPLSYNIGFLRKQKFTSKKPYKYYILQKILTEAIIRNQNWIVNTILNTQKAVIHNNLLLYDSIAAKTKACFISDSSKDILRAYAIWKKRPEKVKIILLYKDAKSYAASGKHWGAQVPIKKRLKKWYRQYSKIYIPILRKMTGCEILPLMYDQVAQAPDKTRLELARFFGTDLNNLNTDWHIDTKNLHLVAGNPMRFMEKIEIKYDDRWRQDLNAQELKIAEYYENKMQKLKSKLPTV